MTEAVAKANYKWRVVDIVVAAIIAVASGVIFWGWDIVCSAPLALFEGVTLEPPLPGVGRRQKRDDRYHEL